MNFKKFLVIGAFCAMFVSCSSSENSSGSSEQAANSGASTPETSAPSIKEITTSLIGELNLVLDPQVPGWDCRDGNPLSDSMTMDEILDSMRRNCVWSEIDGVVNVKFNCFLSTQYKPEEQDKCRDQLNRLAVEAGIISITEAAMIPEQAMIDGVQMSTTGITSWKVDDGVNFVLDVAKWAEISS